MNMLSGLKIWGLLCVIVILGACKKEIVKNNQTEIQQEINNGDKKAHARGAVADDPARVEKLSTIVSAGYLESLVRSEQSASRKPVKPGTDATPPSVSITSPANGATVSGTVNVIVTASDNIGISSVILSVDGTNVGNTSSAPYTISWNSATVADGNHTLTAKATDAAGNTNSSSILVTKNNTIITVPPVNLPASYSLITPPIGFQGAEGSCAVFATTYAARSIEQFYRTNASSYSNTTNIFSPEFVYNQTKVLDCGSGAAITSTLDLMMTKGVCTWQTMPYSYSNGCSLMPTVSQLSEAANYKISSYSRINNTDITAIKTMVVNKHPVIITINPDDSFDAAQPGFIWKAYSGPQGLSHNLVICGYDDSKHAYKVMNSWGSSWGDGGFSWIDYDFFPQTSYAYVYVINS